MFTIRLWIQEPFIPGAGSGIGLGHIRGDVQESSAVGQSFFVSGMAMGSVRPLSVFHWDLVNLIGVVCVSDQGSIKALIEERACLVNFNFLRLACIRISAEHRMVLGDTGGMWLSSLLNFVVWMVVLDMDLTFGHIKINSKIWKLL
ncbi:hypothetical protein NPIL_623031 [Nephila pilipes]|uniref:Uncharacterized protein n=1 Tax=Nephila pilipes TaxID=299642 RepID=A0A8X6T7M0_NEPPI|nr:hypothetical protein NPIL_623031 [Nephila pilipes]